MQRAGIDLSVRLLPVVGMSKYVDESYFPLTLDRNKLDGLHFPEIQRKLNQHVVSYSTTCSAV